MYRIHSSNKFATNSRLGQHYVRIKRKKDYLEAATDFLNVEKNATAVELQQEIEQRLWAVRLRRRIHVRAQYALAILRARGSAKEKFAALNAALFSDRDK